MVKVLSSRHRQIIVEMILAGGSKKPEAKTEAELSGRSDSRANYDAPPASDMRGEVAGA